MEALVSLFLPLLLSALVSGLLAVAVYLGKNWMAIQKEKLETWKHDESDKLYELKPFVELFVKAAEQIYGGGQGEIKKEYVVEQVMLLFPQADPKLVSAAVEAVLVEVREAYQSVFGGNQQPRVSTESLGVTVQKAD